jgi:hypothetical protein
MYCLPLQSSGVMAAMLNSILIFLSFSLRADEKQGIQRKDSK